MSGVGGGELQAVLVELAALAESDPEREICGVVLGRGKAGGVEIVPVRNAAEEPSRSFRADPQDVFRVMRRAEMEGREVACFYHSHPFGGSELSGLDLASLTLDGAPILPGVELWVVGMDRGKAIDVRAHQWSGAGYAEVFRLRAPFTSSSARHLR